MDGPWRHRLVGGKRRRRVSWNQLLGGDLPDYRLTGFGVGRTIGDEPGFTVGLDLDSVDGQRRVSFWTTEDVGRRLGVFLTNPAKPGLGQNSPDAEDR